MELLLYSCWSFVLTFIAMASGLGKKDVPNVKNTGNFLEITPDIKRVNPANLRLSCDGWKLVVSTKGIMEIGQPANGNDEFLTGYYNAHENETTTQPTTFYEISSYTQTGGTSQTPLGLPAHERKTSKNHQGKITKSIVFICLYLIIFLLALVGNSLVIITLALNRSMRTVTNCFLLSLSISDLMVAAVCMPVSLTGRILKEFIFGEVMCKVAAYFMGVSVSVSTFTMLAISIERYYAICNPLNSRRWQTKSHAFKVIIGIWLLSFLIMLPYPVFSQLQYMPLLKQNKCTPACRLVTNNPTVQKFWYSLLLVVLFCIPGLVMTVAYSVVCRSIFKSFHFKSENANGTQRNLRRSERSTTRRENEAANLLKNFQNNTLVPPQRSNRSARCRDADSRMSQNASQLKTKKRIVTMLILIVVLFFVGWTPVYVVNVWKAFDPAGARKSLEGGIEIIKLLSYTSTSVNPIIYCFMNKRFRNGFARAFLCCCPKSYRNKLLQRQQTVFTASDHTQQVSISMTSTRRRRSPSPA